MSEVKWQSCITALQVLLYIMAIDLRLVSSELREIHGKAKK